MQTLDCDSTRRNRAAETSPQRAPGLLTDEELRGLGPDLAQEVKDRRAKGDSEAFERGLGEILRRAITDRRQREAGLPGGGQAAPNAPPAPQGTSAPPTSPTTSAPATSPTTTSAPGTPSTSTRTPTTTTPTAQPPAERTASTPAVGANGCSAGKVSLNCVGGPDLSVQCHAPDVIRAEVEKFTKRYGAKSKCFANGVEQDVAAAAKAPASRDLLAAPTLATHGATTATLPPPVIANPPQPKKTVRAPRGPSAAEQAAQAQQDAQNAAVAGAILGAVLGGVAASSAQRGGGGYHAPAAAPARRGH